MPEFDPMRITSYSMDLLPAAYQDGPQKLTAKFITEAITLDGVLSESVWETLERKD